MLIQIRNWKTDEVIFELDKEYISFKDAVEEAIRQGVDLSYADLFGTMLPRIDLHGAKLNHAILQFSNLEGADLRGADLEFANIARANLSKADLSGAKIRGCSFNKADFTNTIMPDFPMRCPETGSFIGYKKIWCSKEYEEDVEFIVKLEIPEDAKRSSSTMNKCRCSKAKVLEIKDADSGETTDKITNFNIFPCVYKVGEYVYPDSFDECRWNECSNGIHFFMSEEEAIKYGS
jgi:hypothetical protein